MVKGWVLESHKPVLIVAGLVSLLIVIVAMISSVWPTQENWYFELGLLGKDKTADKYFADGNSTVNVGLVNSWFIYVHNYMGEKQSVIVKAKLLNSTMELPHDLEHRASQASSFIEFPLFISADETMFIPFSWSILETESHDDSIIIKRLMVNEQTVNIQVSNSVKSSYKVVFELWVLDNVSGEYKFGWESKDEMFSVSLYMGFNLS